MKYVKYSKDKDKLNQIIHEDKGYTNVSRKTVNMLQIVTNSDLKYNEKEERVNMCEALEGIKDDAKAEGFNIGKTEGINEGKEKGRLEERNIIAETMRKNGFTEDQIKLDLGENLTN